MGYVNRSVFSISLFISCLTQAAHELNQLDKRLTTLETFVYEKPRVLFSGEIPEALEASSKINLSFTVLEPKPRNELMRPADVIARKFPQVFPHCFQVVQSFLEDPRHFMQFNAKIPNKFLLSGPPGCGKSYFVELLSQQYQLPIIYVKATDVQDRFYGESSRKITELFNYRDPQGRPLILFIDEIDAIACQRQNEMFQGDRSTLNALLIELQKVSFDKSIFIFVATNNKEALDKALLDRFEGQCIEMELLSYADRVHFIQDILGAHHIHDEALIKTIAQKSKGLSRRALAAALEASYAWYIHKSKLNPLAHYVAEDILMFIQKAKSDHKISWSSKITQFIKTTSPTLTYVNLSLGTVLMCAQLASNAWLREVVQDTLHSIRSVNNIF